jgi:hypothetical protein
MKSVPPQIIVLVQLSRGIRSASFKLIYNCTPHQAVAPVDSRRDPGWQQMKAAFAEGKLTPEFVRAYFTTPRCTYELYDLGADPGELTNLASNKKYAQVEREIKEALTAKTPRRGFDEFYGKIENVRVQTEGSGILYQHEAIPPPCYHRRSWGGRRRCRRGTEFPIRCAAVCRLSRLPAVS